MMCIIKKIKYILPLLAFLLSSCATVHDAQDNSYSFQNDKKITAANAEIQLGMLYLEKGNVVTAKRKLLSALSLAPKYPASWYTMGYYLEVTGNSEQADKYYKTAVRLAPNNGDAQNNYGTFLCHTGRFEASIPHFVKAVADPSYANNAAAYENAGLCAMMIPDIKLAKTYFTKAITQNPKQLRSLVNLAEIDYKQGQYLSAKSLINYAIKISGPTKEMLGLKKKIISRLKKAA